MFCRDASGLSSVWSIMDATAAGAPPVAVTPRRVAPASITTQPVRAAIGRGGVAGTARGSLSREGCSHLLDNDVTELLQFLSRHDRSGGRRSKSRILARHRMYLASRIGVVSQVEMMALASSSVTSAAPSVSTFAPLCSRE